MWSSARPGPGWPAALAVAAACSLCRAGDLHVDVTDLQGHPLADAVIYATRAGNALAASGPAPRATIDQVNKEFVPLVNVIRTGTEVRFPNSDNIRHSIYSFSAPKVFTEKLYSGKEAAPVVFDKPGLVVLGCNIHDQMVAWVVVVDTPYFSKSDAGGAADLKELPAGNYRLEAWYPGPTFAPVAQNIHLTAADTPAKVSITLDTTGSPLPALQAKR